MQQLTSLRPGEVFAERRGVEIRPERTVTGVRPLRAADGSDGYAVTHERSGAWLARDRQRLTPDERIGAVRLK